MRSFDLQIGDSTVKRSPKTPIKSPYDGTPVSEAVFAGPEEIESAIKSACNAFPTISRMPAHKRSQILRKISEGIAGRIDDLALAICEESGKPVTLARIEAERAVSTFSVAAEEALRIEGDLLPLDRSPIGEGRMGLLRRFPIGPIVAITPFNFPLNLVAHKVAPAIAAGNSIIVKPSSQTPSAALMLMEIARDGGLPPGVLNVVPCPGHIAETMVSDPRLKMLTFTGSADTGWALKGRAGRKRVTLELGGNAGAIVGPDANMEEAASKLAFGAFANAGQVCISVQRIFVHESIVRAFTDYFTFYVKRNIVCGNPKDPGVTCGPIIDTANADRIQRWIKDAVDHGARILCGGERKGNVIAPTVLTEVDPALDIVRKEAFGPVVSIASYRSFDETITAVNDSDYGLQAGVFTRDVEKLMKAFRELEVGAVIHNDGPTFRVDSMPYGGTKGSGLGREGLRYAIEEMTEPRLLVLRERT
ncbi:MAG: aldehyde dehydrogenase family protein [Chloroflexi bacterium]|nr:aldehyde dehydrogenase family protein [Chloroflexota bacterium]